MAQETSPKGASTTLDEGDDLQAIAGFEHCRRVALALQDRAVVLDRDRPGIAAQALKQAGYGLAGRDFGPLPIELDRDQSRTFNSSLSRH